MCSLRPHHHTIGERLMDVTPLSPLPSDREILQAVSDFREGHGVFPTDGFGSITPADVVLRVRQLEADGFLRGWTLTQKGIAALAEPA